MKKEKLIQILKTNITLFNRWVEICKQEIDLRYANLRYANLRYANLSDADLRYANLRYADLRYADLRYANLRYANLRYANLRYADLRYADLRYADLRYANLRYANLSDADLRYANLRYANLSDANLSDANLSDANLNNIIFNHVTSFLTMSCPDEGSYIAWKKANKKIVKLFIPSNAKRSSATTYKCRASRAKVLEIQDIEGNKLDITEVESSHDTSFIYRVGEYIDVADFDNDRWNECSTGIHHFISRQQAVNW